MVRSEPRSNHPEDVVTLCRISEDPGEATTHNTTRGKQVTTNEPRADDSLRDELIAQSRGAIPSRAARLFG